jgi:uncharacterized protein (TIGR02147 family)
MLARLSSASTMLAEIVVFRFLHVIPRPMENKSPHLQYLSNELEQRVRRNGSYSMRSFARDLSITSSWLSEVLSGKKGMSAEKAKTLCYSLGLSSVESKLFQLSVKAAHSRSEKDRNQAAIELKNFRAGKSSLKKMTKDEFQPMSDWYYLAILELTELSECEHQPEWFAKKLNLPLKLVSAAITRLLDQGHLVYEKKIFRAVNTESSTTFDIPSDTIKKYHRQIMDQASQALQEQPVQQRDFLNMTLAFEIERAEEAQKVLRKFQQEFAEKFYPENSENKNSVYQLSLHFFRLDKKGV